MSRFVRRGLRQRWSPQQINGRLEREHPHDPTMRISHETIYAIIGVTIFGWKLGGGVIPRLILFAAIAATWCAITKNRTTE